jgi:hypothetical protein
MNLKKIKQFKTRTKHDPILEGNNKSFLTVGYFPKNELNQILPNHMAIPSDAIMTTEYPTIPKQQDKHPFLMMFSNCFKVHDIFTEIDLRPYKELMFYIPVIYTHKGEEQLCSYIPELYLDYLFGVIGGLYLGLRKKFHPRMINKRDKFSESFFINNILDAKFTDIATENRNELDPFFKQIFKFPAITRTYFNRIRFYQNNVYTSKVVDASSQYEWIYKGVNIQNDEKTLSCYAEYNFTTSHAMSFNGFFHPKYKK